MTPKAIVELFSSNNLEGFEYLQQEGMLDLLKSVGEQGGDRIPPNYSDLARLHKVIRARKAFTVLEFGLGFSTIVMADALLKNHQDWNKLNLKPTIRNSTIFQLHTVDTSETWIERTKTIIPKHLEEVVTFYYSTVKASTFQDRSCHFYEKVPDIVPDFIYLDGPDPSTVIGDIGGLSWHNYDRVVTSGDILRMEPQLLPGTLIIVDGRTANARFLKAMLYRTWQVAHSTAGDVSVFELQEPPLGRFNHETLLYCLGSRALNWSE